MNKDKLKDFIDSMKDESADVIISSNPFRNLIIYGVDFVASEGVAELIGTMIGSTIPYVNDVRLGYKQNRLERNILEALTLLGERIKSLEYNYNLLNNDMKNKFNGCYKEWLLDSLFEEKQTEKVPYFVNGYINLMTNEANDNLMIMFFNTINELTQLDIDVLKIYDYASDSGTIPELCDRYNLDNEQVRVIKEKLYRLGLLASRNEENINDNIEKVVKYVGDNYKDLNSRKPKGVKLPHFKRINRFESYHITTLGQTYLKLISDQPL